jgi:hypothetical protein
MIDSSKVLQIPKNFIQSVINEDELGAVIRAHLYIEAELNNYLEACFSNPKYLNKLELPYEKSVVLAIACGLHERLEKPLKAIGTLRNKFAHRIGFTLDKSTVNSLVDTLDLGTKNAMLRSYERTKQHPEVNLTCAFDLLEPKDKFSVFSTTILSDLMTATHKVKAMTTAQNEKAARPAMKQGR